MHCLVLALEEGEEVRGGEEGDGTRTRGRAGGNLETHERNVVIGDDGDQAKLAKQDRGGAAGQHPCVNVEERLGGGEQLKFVGERQQLLSGREGARRLQLGEDARILRGGQDASLGEVGRQAQVLNARQQAKWRLLRGLGLGLGTTLLRGDAGYGSAHPVATPNAPVRPGFTRAGAHASHGGGCMGPTAGRAQVLAWLWWQTRWNPRLQ